MYVQYNDNSLTTQKRYRQAMPQGIIAQAKKSKNLSDKGTPWLECTKTPVFCDTKTKKSVLCR